MPESIRPTFSHWAILRRLGAWVLAAAAPDAFVEWSGIAAADERRAWEATNLGEGLGWVARSRGLRWGLDPGLCECLWVLEEEAPLDAVCPGFEVPLAALRAAEEWVEKTPLGLFPDPEQQPAEAKNRRNWVAEFLARAERDLCHAAQSPREELLVRGQARLMLNLRRETSRHAAARCVLSAMTAPAATASAEEWALAARSAIEPLYGEGHVDVRWLDRADATPAPAHAEPDELHTLEVANQTLAQIRIWHGSGVGGVRLEPDDVAALSAWAGRFAELDRLRQVLRQTVSVRQRQAAQSEGPLQPNIESLAHFAAGAGHELNNPLAVIMGRAQLLLQRTQDPEAQRSLRVLISQCQRAHRMLRDLMFVARPVEPRVRPLNPADVLLRSLDDLADDAAARSVSLRTEISDLLPVLETDPEQFRHIVEVLTRNALEASASGSTVVVRCEHRDDRMLLEVWDQGCGFSREEGRHILVPFYCGRHAGRGLGLGLPRIAHYIAGIGGTLKWSSKPGVGTVFRVTLPCSAINQISAA